MPDNNELTFKKCDLHVHSSSCESRSYSYNDFESTLLDSDLDVIAITDHNMVDTELLNKLSSNLARRGKKLLAGVELSLHFDEELIRDNKLELSDGATYFHGIVWCDIADATALQSSVFTLLDGIGIGPEVRQGKTAKEISSLSKGKSFSFTKMQSSLKSIKYFFTFHENKGDDQRNLSGYLKKKNPRNDRFKESLFYYNQRLAVEGGKRSRPISDWFEENLDATVSCFFCSDAQTLENIGSRFTWIDFDGDLDSLNLAITDPQSRIATSDVCPGIPQSNLLNYLEAIKFNLRDESGKSAEQELLFAPSYNGVIGSRGSGKSMLAKLLTGKIDDAYGKYVERDSVRFRMKGSAYSQNTPKCLFLNQGELGDVFDKASYRSVPFLNSRLTKMKTRATAASEKCFNEIKVHLENEKEAVLSFLEKYRGGLKRPDVLLRKEPSGFALDAPPKIDAMTNEYVFIEEKIAKIEESLESLIKIAGALKPSADFPERAALAKALDKRLTNLRTALADGKDNAVVIKNALGALHAEPFETRKILLKEFTDILVELNKEKALGFHNYTAALTGAKSFLEDLLELNIKINGLDQQIQKTVSEMLSPIAPEAYQADSDEVVIGLSFAETISYEDSIARQFKQKPDTIPPIVSLCLHSLSNQNPKNLLNGTRYRNADTIDKCLERYFRNIEDDLAKNKELEIDISFNGKQMREMSPGMQAQALLKLLLNDSVVDEQYDYVVLDQPEDNLDTPTISEVLVDRIKKLKKKTQFFVISHSAPVIINGDARRIIVAQAGNSSISYKEGTINGKDTKNMIAEVLDGGERYLKMRLYKYDFQMDEERKRTHD